MTNLKESFETFIPHHVDSKGRKVGYVVGLREIADESGCYAWVQKSISANGLFYNRGTVQRSKLFPSLDAAKTWAYATAKERAAKL
jgi:hypothetical protein